MNENPNEKPWYKKDESFWVRVRWFFSGSAFIFILVLALYLSNTSSSEYRITLIIISSLIGISAIIMLIVKSMKKE
ncbi:MAG TPA: hypothetical protein VMZ29_01190 [Candidatus Bathyarchaeia archaeon]|nr:hypothetical protein [Candidatus Bathyarchaeia archaeon]